ncbi:MAG: DUF4435 domain-containing protein [Prevotellaceae bacterium]|nr:DUF4435 domain-containing protein [Prevotellaceae bacterium]MDY3856048.1 DUF4435 domain-containing protein [Bacteroidaceae bacterium]
MSHRLKDNLTNDYIAASSRLRSRRQRRRIVVYVESYDDVFFWRSLLDELETDSYYFEVMLPSRQRLQRGKKSAIMSALSGGLGPNLIVCCDADYDYLLQGATGISAMVCNNPYIFHTYTYAIENFQCYAPSLHTVCVMATLNDRQIFDFEAFLTAYSKIIFPLLVWSVWCYKTHNFKTFNLQDFATTAQVSNVDIQNPNASLSQLHHRVNAKIAWLQRHLPQAKGGYQQMRDELGRLGVTEDNAYLYMRGHDLFDKVVEPLMVNVCCILTARRESEIKRSAVHSVQRTNEISGYEHSSSSVDEMMRKQTHYRRCALYQQIQSDIREMINRKGNPLPNLPVWDPDQDYSEGNAEHTDVSHENYSHRAIR